MPRPTGPSDGPPMKMTSIRLPEGLWPRVQAKAHALGLYGSEVAQELLEKWDADHPDPPPDVEPPRRGRNRAT